MSVTTPERTTVGASPALPSRSDISTVLLLSHLAWVGWLWATVLVLLPIALVVLAVAGTDVDTSLWAPGGIGWQRWIMFTCGVLTATTFLREFVSRGVTRRRLAESAVASMIALAVLTAVLAIVGYTIEAIFFRAQDWTHELQSEVRFSGGMLPRLATEYALTGAVHFAVGCLVGAAFRTHHWFRAIFFLPLCAIPVALTLSRATRSLNTSWMPGWLDDPHVGLTIGVGVAVVVVASVVATRVIRSLPLR
jgi:hypothetical protein